MRCPNGCGWSHSGQEVVSYNLHLQLRSAVADGVGLRRRMSAKMDRTRRGKRKLAGNKLTHGLFLRLQANRP